MFMIEAKLIFELLPERFRSINRTVRKTRLPQK